jgi:hypothetical protein
MVGYHNGQNVSSKKCKKKVQATKGHTPDQAPDAKAQ